MSRAIDPAAGEAMPAAHKSRRSALAMLGGLAAAPALAILPAVAIAATGGEPDPIFAAIEEHKIADRQYGDAATRTDAVAAERDGREITPSDEAALEAANEVERLALAALLATVPQTCAGARAGLAYVASIDWVGELWAFAEALLKSPVFAV